MKKIIFLLLILSFFLGFITSFYIIKPLNTSKFKLLNEVADLITTKYVDEKNEIDLINGLLSSLGDSYSQFYTPQEFSSLKEDLRGEYTGIGVLIGKREDKIEILMVFKNSPAEEAKLPVHSFIIEVDGINVEGKSVDEVANLVRGKEGTKVNLKVQKDGEILIFNIVRRRIVANTVIYKKINEEIGYIRIITFTDVTPNEIKDAFNELKDIKGLILDLRDNPGGLLSSLIDVSRYFVPEGTLFYSETKGVRKEFKSNGPGINIPLVVLINQNSASASEILAGAIKDRNIGILVGEKSYGKGLIQTIFNLSDGYGLVLTTERYLTPSLYALDKKGLEPNLVIKYEEIEGEPDMDTQLKKAIEILNEKIKKWYNFRMLIIISGPSGSGKGTIIKEFLKRYPEVCYSVSYTTRPRREGEEDGKDYYFIDKKEFEELIKKDFFIEWAKVYDYYYGTSKEYILKKLKEKKDVLLEIEIQGAKKIREIFDKKETIFIFILPPDFNELKRRIINRKRGESDDEINKRIEFAKQEIEESKNYDYIIINDRIDKAVERLIQIFDKERRKRNGNKLWQCPKKS